MPQLLVRDVPQEVVDALERKAAEHGRSGEAEHGPFLKKRYGPRELDFGYAPGL
jgi:plasmid stability protein